MTPDEPPEAPEIDELLRSLDHPTPTVTAADVRARARRAGRSPWRRAAAIGLLLATGATGVVYAAPNSALRAWLVEVRSRIGLGAAGIDSETPPASRPADQRGIALDARVPITIEVTSDGGRGWVRLALSDGERIEVRSPSPTTVFLSERTRLSVEHPSPDTLDIAVPRSATSVALVIGDRVRWTAQRGAVRADAGDASGAAWVVALSDRGR